MMLQHPAKQQLRFTPEVAAFPPAGAKGLIRKAVVHINCLSTSFCNAREDPSAGGSALISQIQKADMTLRAPEQRRVHLLNLFRGLPWGISHGGE